MALSPGDKLGPYECIALTGKGGMGEVWKAHDPRLKRDVAIKVSAAQFSERFEREAKAIAALNHPNICTLHDVGPNYLVMEYIEGTPLKGPLPIDQALKYAAQICDALDAAHKKGITHRDLKPANILVTKAGIKLLDFGLAKLGASGIGQAAKPLNDATLTMALTGKNEIVGTLYYMSPEQLQAQASGQEIDGRSDIFSFGIVLYELLTGKRAFEGSSPASVIAAIMERPAPSISDVAPPALDRVLRKCLAKDPDDRWQSARDLKDELEWITSVPTSGSAVAAVPNKMSRFGSSAWIATGVLAIGFAVAGVGWYRSAHSADPPLKPLVRLDVDLGSDVVLNSPGGSDVIVSRDGTRIAYVSQGKLFTRKLDQPKANELSITQGATSPFFSPDGQWIGFTAGGKLREISVDGGGEVVLADAGSSYTGDDWGDDGNIIAALTISGGLSRVPAAGGVATPVTELQRGEATHRLPQILPGGKAVLFTVHRSTTGFDDANIEVVTLADRRRKMLQRGGTFGRYLPASAGQGFLMYISRGTLFAAPFDPEKVETSGSPVPVMQQVPYSQQFGSAQLSFSSNGTFVLRPGGIDAGLLALQWLDASGKLQPLLSKTDLVLTHPRLSPDGQRLAMLDADLANGGVRIYDLTRDTMTRLTSGGSNLSDPVWTPDGQYVVYSGTGGIAWARADGGSKPQLLTQSKLEQDPKSFTPDGKRLAFSQIGQRFDLWTTPVELDGNGLVAGKPEPFLQSPDNEMDPSFSSDGRWIAYSSDESGRFEVYVRAFPDKGLRWQVSGAGGTAPMFSKNGRELFFRGALDDRIMVADYSVKGDSFVAGKPRAWSETRLPQIGILRGQFDVTPDGKRVAALTYREGSAQQASGHIVFFQNFVDELRRKVPVGK